MDSLADPSCKIRKLLPRGRETTACTWIKDSSIGKSKHLPSLSPFQCCIWSLGLSCCTPLHPILTLNPRYTLPFLTTLYLPACLPDSHTLAPLWSPGSNGFSNYTKCQAYKLSGTHLWERHQLCQPTACPMSSPRLGPLIRYSPYIYLSTKTTSQHCYRLNVSLQIYMLKHNPQCDGI